MELDVIFKKKSQVETPETKDRQDEATEGTDGARDQNMNTEGSEKRNTENETSSTEIAIKVIVKQDGDFSVQAEYETNDKGKNFIRNRHLDDNVPSR